MFYSALFAHHSTQKHIAALFAFICDILHWENHLYLHITTRMLSEMKNECLFIVK